MYRIRTDKKVEKFIIAHPDIWVRFFEKVTILQQDPRDPRLSTKRLQGSKDKYRLRIGKYRFLYEVKEQEILIYFYDADSRGMCISKAIDTKDPHDIALSMI